MTQTPSEFEGQTHAEVEGDINDPASAEPGSAEDS